MSKFIGWYYLSYNWQYYILHPWQFVWDLFRDIRAIYYRGTRGWAPCDTWSLDNYLSSWMSDALRFLKEYKHGIPGEFAGKTEKDFQKGIKECDKTMDKMIKGFEASLTLSDAPINFPDNFNKLSQDEKDAYWKKSHKEMERLSKIEQEGLQLFAKYFDNLWD